MTLTNKNYALLIDIASIQKYIFQSNKLSLNVGASYIVEKNLFSKNMLPKSDDCIGYRGGGNALFLFDTVEKRADFERTYRHRVLEQYPGVKVAVGTCDTFDGSRSGFQSSMKELHASLRKAKNHDHTNVHLPQHGLAGRCTLTGESQAESRRHGMDVSTAAYYKLDAADMSTRDYYDLVYEDHLGDWRFTNEIDQLGQPDTKSYVAIVHVDGNGIGNEFRNSESLAYTQELSAEVSRLASTIMEKIIIETVRIADEIRRRSHEKAFQGFSFKKDEEGKYYLPIRPILAGGDDFTFVCEGKLGVYLAEKMIQFIEAYEPELTEFSDDKQPRFNKACAGVAIVPTKFPFFKAYQLSEELCQKAKRASRADGGASYLSFMLFRRNTSKGLDELIDLQYTNVQIEKRIQGEGEKRVTVLHQAYGMSRHHGSSPWNRLMDQLQEFHTVDSWSNSRIMALRDVLYDSHDKRAYFTTLFNARKKDGATLSITGDTEIVLHDAIELYDFYPYFLIPMNAHETI